MNKIKIFIIVLFLGGIGGCSVESEFDPSVFQDLPEAKWYLTEYIQDGETLYDFTYSGFTLLTQTLHGPYGDINFALEYDEAGAPKSMHAQVIERVYDVYYFHESDQLVRIEFFVDQEELIRFLFFYNDQGKIVATKEIYRSDFEKEITYIWEENNIVRYEVHNMNTGNELDWVFEFEYDDKKNPFFNVYQNIGYDFFQNLPLTSNNWTKKTVYRKGTPDIKAVYNNKIEYWGPNYPLFSTTEVVDSDGQIYTSKVDFSY